MHMFVVAELACGHSGDPQKLVSLVKGATLLNASALKIQLFRVGERSVPNTYEHDLFKKHYLNLDCYAEAISQVNRQRQKIIADIYGLDSLLDALSLQLDGVKIHAEDSENYGLIRKAYELFDLIIVSIGGSSFKSVCLLRDFLVSLNSLSSDAPKQIFFVDGIQLFPTPRAGHKLYNLRKLLEVLNGTSIQLGIADHLSPDDLYSSVYPCIAASMGATYIEKHFTLRRSDQWTDWHSAFEADSFNRLIDCISSVSESSSPSNYDDYLEMSSEYKKMFRKIPFYSESPNHSKVSALDYRKQSVDPPSFISGSFVHNQFASKFSSQELNTVGSSHDPLRYLSFPHKTGAIITIRSSSTRLPNKALLPILNTCSADVVAKRASLIKGVDLVVFATSTHESDDLLAGTLQELGYPVFRGSLENVPKRMLDCAIHFGLDHIVRITGDCVCLDFSGMSQLLETHLTSSPDVSILDNGIFGTCKEILSCEALRYLSHGIIDDASSEYFEYYFSLPNLLTVIRLPVGYTAPPSVLANRLTLDYSEDLSAINLLYSQSPNGILTSCEDMSILLTELNEPLPNYGLLQRSPSLMGFDLPFDLSRNCSEIFI